MFLLIFFPLLLLVTSEDVMNFNIWKPHLFRVYAVTLFYILYRQILGKISWKIAVFILSKYLCPKYFCSKNIFLAFCKIIYFAKKNFIFYLFFFISIFYFILFFIFFSLISQVCSKLAMKIFELQKRLSFLISSCV